MTPVKIFSYKGVLKLVTQLESEPESNQIGEIPEEVPFVIPEKWKWAKLSDVAIFNPKVAPDDELEATFLPMAAVSAGYENKIDTTEIQSWRKIKSGYSKFADGDIIMAKITPCFQNLKSAICKNLCNGIGAGSTEFHVIRPNSLLNPTYLLIFLKSPYLLTYGIENFKGTAGQQRIGTNDLKKCLIPLPPLEEQKRIVACVENLRSHINSYQNEEQQLSALQSSFKEKLRASILQEAIQGKLVPQLESEPEMPQIGGIPENIPFDIPSKWKWMSLENVLTEISDGSHNPPPNSGKGVPVLSAKNINNGIIDTQLVTRWTTEEQWAIEDRKIHIEPGDVLLTIVGTIGRTAVVPDDAPKFMLQRSVCVMKTKNFLNSKFLSLMLTSPALLEWMMDRASGTAQKGIYLKALRAMPLPIPPLSEQHRIVGKLTELFNKLNQIDKLK